MESFPTKTKQEIDEMQRGAPRLKEQDPEEMSEESPPRGSAYPKFEGEFQP
jgi:hypothetical protein